VDVDCYGIGEKLFSRTMADVGTHVLKKGFLVKKVKVWPFFLYSFLYSFAAHV